MVDERKYQHVQLQMLVMNLHRLWCLAQCPEAPSVSYWGFFLMHRVTLYKRELLLRSSHDTVHTKKSFSVARTQKQKVRFYSVFWGQFLEWAGRESVMNCFQFSLGLLVSRPNIGLARLTLRKRGLARAQAADCKDST